MSECGLTGVQMVQLIFACYVFYLHNSLSIQTALVPPLTSVVTNSMSMYQTVRSLELQTSFTWVNLTYPRDPTNVYF